MIGQEYIIISSRSEKSCTNKCFYTRLLNVVLNFSYYVTMAAQHPISKIVFARKITKRVQVTVSYKHDNFVTEHVASSNNIQNVLKFVIFNKYLLGMLA